MNNAGDSTDNNGDFMELGHNLDAIRIYPLFMSNSYWTWTIDSCFTY